MAWFISDAHHWIQSSKTTIGNTVVVCTRCKVECEAKNFTDKLCKPHIENPKTGFKNKASKYVIYTIILNLKLLKWKLFVLLAKISFNKYRNNKE